MEVDGYKIVRDEVEGDVEGTEECEAEEDQHGMEIGTWMTEALA